MPNSSDAVATTARTRPSFRACSDLLPDFQGHAAVVRLASVVSIAFAVSAWFS